MVLGEEDGSREFEPGEEDEEDEDWELGEQQRWAVKQLRGLLARGRLLACLRLLALLHLRLFWVKICLAELGVDWVHVVPAHYAVLARKLLDRLAGWLAGWLTDARIGGCSALASCSCVATRLTDWLPAWLAASLTDWFTDRLTNGATTD